MSHSDKYVTLTFAGAPSRRIFKGKESRGDDQWSRFFLQEVAAAGT